MADWKCKKCKLTNRIKSSSMQRNKCALNREINQRLKKMQIFLS